jgi:hypothetical protein
MKARIVGWTVLLLASALTTIEGEDLETYISVRVTKVERKLQIYSPSTAQKAVAALADGFNGCSPDSTTCTKTECDTTGSVIGSSVNTQTACTTTSKPSETSKLHPLEGLATVISFYHKDVFGIRFRIVDDQTPALVAVDNFYTIKINSTKHKIWLRDNSGRWWLLYSEPGQ